MEIIKFFHEGNDFTGSINHFMTMMAYFNTIINCSLAIYFSIISVVYKTKDVLSSKTNLLEAKTAIFKIIIPLLWRVAENNRRMQIFALVLAVLNMISHDWIFIKYLPYYRVSILLLNAVFQALQTSLALISIIIKAIEASQTKANDIGIFSVQIVWLLVVPIFMKLYRTSTWKKLGYIFGCEIKNEKNIYYLVHKRFIFLYFLKSRQIVHQGISQFSYADLIYQARLTEVVLNSEYSFEELDVNKNLLIRSLKTICLEILSRYPGVLLAQINLANSFSNFEDLYLVSNNLIEDAISKGPGYQAQASLNLIHLELQKKLKVQFSQKTKDGLDIHSYIANQELHEEMKKNIEKQTETQLRFWNEFMSNKPNMLKLLNFAFEVQDQKTKIKKIWNNLVKIRPPSFLSPTLIYGMYSSLINNNPVEGGKYMKQSQEDMKRINKAFSIDELNNQTIFSDKVVKITMSGFRSQLGKIIDCSANIANFYGWQVSDIKGRSIGSLMPSFFRQRHDGFLLNHFNTGKTRILNKTLVIPVKQANGYIHPSWIHAKVSPFMENGIFYVGILKPCKPSQRMVLVKKDGKIDDMSFEFAKDMNLTRDHELNIFTFCPEFKQINEAFNLIAIDSIETSPINIEENDLTIDTFDLMTSERNLIQGRATERPLLLNSGNKRNLRAGKIDSPVLLSRIDKEKAQSIYDNFTTGSTLMFHPQNTTESISYNAKIMNSIHGKDVIKFVLLEDVSGGDDNQSDEEVVFSSLKMITTPHNLRKEIILSPTKIQTSLRLKTKFKQLTENHYNDDTEGDLSILGEVQDFDSAARHVITRNILNNDTSNFSSPHKTQNAFFTEPGESKKKLHSFGDNQALHKEDNHQERTNKLKDSLQNPVLNAAEIEKSVSSSYISKGKKVEQMVAQALTAKPKKKSAKLFTYLSLVFIISMIVLLVIQNLNLHFGINHVQAHFPVIAVALWRQYNMIYSATMMRQWKGALDGVFSRDWVNHNLEFNSYLVYYTDFMNYYNTEFYQLLAQLPEETQKKFYEKDVRIYEYFEDGNKTLISADTTFEAIQSMIEKEQGCLNMQIPAQYTPDIDKSSFSFVLDNAPNDLLIRSENQIVELVDELNNTTSATTEKIGMTLGVVLTVCLTFIMISLRYLRLIASEARTFMTMIFHIKPQECEAIRVILQHFISGLGQNLKIQQQEKIKIEEDKNNNSPIRFRKASMSPLYRSQRITFCKLLPIFSIFICWGIVYFFLTSDFIADIKDSQKRMEAALQTFNIQGVFAYGILSIPLTNATARIRNGPIIPRYMENLDTLRKVSEFANRFRDRRGKLTPFMEDVLFGFRCETFLPIMAKSEASYEGFIYAYEGCVNIANGKDAIGLVEIYTQLYNNGMPMLEQYYNSNKTTEELGDIFLSVIDSSFDLINTAEGFIELLYDVTEEYYNEEVGSIQTTAWVLSLLVIIVTLTATWITWSFVMKKIFRIQKIDWFILQIIPIQLILSSKHIQQYLLKHSDGRFDSVRSYL